MIKDDCGGALGFKDRYTDSGGIMSGWEGDILSEPVMYGKLKQRNIDEICNYITQPSMMRSGIIRTWRILY